jgi:hypothetical protein
MYEVYNRKKAAGSQALNPGIATPRYRLMWIQPTILTPLKMNVPAERKLILATLRHLS